MIGLATASVAVIDNDPNEGLPLIKAFSSAGIGAIYLSGDPDEFPEPNTLKGVRLVALDIHLTDADMDDEQTARQPVQVLKCIMGRANGPYMVLLWTTRPELAELFHRYVKEIEWPPVFTCVLSKSEVRDEDGILSLELIKPRIMDSIRDAHPLQVMMLWGQIVHDATSATLVSLGPDKAANWMSEVGGILAALVRENTPRAALSDHARCMMGLFGALDQIFADQLEAAATEITAEEKDCMGEIVANAKTSSGTNVQLASQINRNLLLGPVVDKTGAPGSVYLVSKFIDPVMDEMADLVSDTLITVELTSRLQTKELRENAANKSLLVAVEITPVCDHQQDKHRLVRLLGGIAVPAGFEKAIFKAEYIRTFPSISFADADLTGEYILAWNVHFLVTRKRDSLRDHSPVYRVRQAALSDLLAFHANHSARPGYLSIRR